MSNFYPVAGGDFNARFDTFDERYGSSLLATALGQISTLIR